MPITAAAYYGYGRDSSFSAMRGNPVKAALIGCGDEGGVLVNDHDPNYVNIVAISDIRPSNTKRIFVGDPPPNNARRRGLNFHYGHDADKRIKHFEKYEDLLADRSLGIEMVIIALPLPLHHQAVIDCLNAEGIKGILCEKLMAWNITQCKDMIRKADEAQKLLAIGHQRHYSMLYAHANEVVQSGILGDIRYIRALWHRNNAVPRLDSAGRPMMETYNGKQIPVYKDSWRKDVPREDADKIASRIRDFGWKDMNELVRWRLFRRTGGGLMAELGSHQLDACSIFLSKPDPAHAGQLIPTHPLAVSGVGGKNFYQDERECEDNVYCTFEFPGKHYEAVHPHYADGKAIKHRHPSPIRRSARTTSSSDAECVMGTTNADHPKKESTRLPLQRSGPIDEVTAGTGGGRPTIDASSSSAPIENKRAQEAGAGSMGPTISYGYTEEMTHMAYLVKHQGQMSEAERNRPENKLRCDGRKAMADAIIALTANQAMRRNQRIEFKENWFRRVEAERAGPGHAGGRCVTAEGWGKSRSSPGVGDAEIAGNFPPTFNDTVDRLQ